MSDFTERRTPLLRSTTAASSPALGYAVGDIPPELSPLDELAVRGRMLRKQLTLGNNDGRIGLTPQSIHRSLRRPDRSPTAAEPGYLERSFSLDSQQSFARRIDGIGIHFSSVSDDDRPLSTHPRFSSISEASSRDSTASVITIRPENVLGYGDREHTPNLQDNPDRHNAKHEFDFGRESIKPSIQNVFYEEPESNTSEPTDSESRAEVIDGRGNGQIQSARKSEVPAPPVRHDSGHEASESEHVSLQDNRASPMTRLNQYNPQNDSTTQRNQHNHSGYQAYNPNLQPQQPKKQPSRENELRVPPIRKDSRDSARNSPQLLTPQLRQSNTNSINDNVSNSILPMLSTLRASSPDGERSSFNLGPPSPTPPLNRETSQDNYDWLHDFSKSAGQPPDRPQSSASQMTLNGSKTASKAINFSRPILSAKPSIDVSAAVEFGRPSYNNNNDSSPLNTPVGTSTPCDTNTPAGVQTPIGTAETQDGEPITSYTYTRFYLPRGRVLDRNSLIFTDEPKQSENTNPQPPPSPRTPQPPPQQEPVRKHSYTAYTPPVPVTPIVRSHTSPEKGSDYVSMVLRQHPHRPANLTISTAAKSAHLTPPSLSPGAANRSTSSLQPPKTPRSSPSREHMLGTATLTADEHVNIGIECHEKGSLQQSSYHLRCAANAGHPTGMLLYALSLRHGWGMRANPTEAIEWLKKVIHIMGEDAQNQDMDASAKNFFEEKGRKAQFALSVYELGMCHLNGWGTNVDKAYALKCFEIAAKWGDADALSEAGYCYYHGVGTKKDLKKSAKYYRMAEAKGVNMVGNSWIWKEKYLDDEARREMAKKEGRPEPPPADSKQSHHGGLFGRKKDKH